MTDVRAPTVPGSPPAARLRTWWRRIRLLGGALVLAVIVWRLGAGPFLDGVAALDAAAVAAAVGVGAATTVCAAWRWRLVARGLGMALPMRAAVAAYYRSQFLNATLPGGVVGDVHRGWRHGRDVADLGRGLRAVAWERAAGPVVHVALTVAVLAALGSPVQFVTPALAALLAVVIAGAAALAATAGPQGRGGRWARLCAAAAADLRAGVLAPAAWRGVLLASVLVAAGHAAIFVLAARISGTEASLAELAPIAMLVLLAMVVPLNIGGWGPREGVAAWAFAAAGWGAAQGVAAATAYGLLALAATLPGAAVLLGDAVARRAARIIAAAHVDADPGRADTARG
jgi:glycosyltransferase 2 family protein